jgi:hypothetical protein
MKSHALLTSAGVALLVGAAQYFLLAFAWAYIGAYNPLPGLLAHHVNSVADLKIYLLPVDCLINFILALPAAYILIKLRPLKLWLYLFLAVMPAFLWSNRSLIGSPYFAVFAWQFVTSWIVQLLAIPVAAWLLLAITKNDTPNNLTKQTQTRIAGSRH